ncbi:NEP-interacting protein 1 [Citrus sinensis]|uniref:NEP-interacting protein 1 n=1 Tax=Citrus sinensis TaxID=2711 RepID=A0ACB8J8E3_CITSI|nr:NEP-interacting protein 1 [Citrus sinensis]
MADWNDKSIKLGDYKFFLILLSHTLITSVDGRGVDQFMKNRELPMHKGTVKTIESDDGDVIGCVDIRKQPAFNHPLLKNHTVQNPLTNFGELSIAQIWVLAGDGNELNSLEAGWMFNNNDGNWWLQVQDQLVGYWPSSIFTHLAGTSDAISWGGEIVNNQPNGHHTSTQMGSGHFPNEAYGKASYFTKLGYFDEGNNVKDPENLEPFVTRPPCYDLRTGKDNKFGVFFYFGGPGYSTNCQ